MPLKRRNIINRTWKAELSQQLNLIVLKLFGSWGGDGEFVFNGCRISVWDDDKDLEMDSGDRGTALLIANH